MKHRDLWEIYRRWRAGQSLARIAAGTRRERKTVRRYLRGFAKLGLDRDGPVVERQRFYEMVTPLLAGNTRRPAPAADQWLRHCEELRELINRTKDPLKPKSAYLVVKTKYGLDGSYERFKRVARAAGLNRPERRRMIRIELPPGLETQIDYGRVGTIVEGGISRVVWAFCGLLTHSRLPYVEFVRTQDQQSFTGSFCSMWHFYGGSTEFVSPDNLKAGVLKPDLWDPQINRALGEAAEHYGVFVDPCRVGRSTDKGKVERFVPVARELFRRLAALHVDAPLRELNEHARHWCRHEYGRAEHGTTGVAPMEAFAQERTALKALPDQRFETPVWKRVSVQRACRRPVRELRHDALLAAAGVARPHAVGALRGADATAVRRPGAADPPVRGRARQAPVLGRRRLSCGGAPDDRRWLSSLDPRAGPPLRAGGRGVAGLGAAAARLPERPAGARDAGGHGRACRAAVLR